MSSTPLVHVVVHVNEPAEAVEQCAAVAAAGLGSVFLIDHHVRGNGPLFEAVRLVRERCPALAVGVNLLTQDPHRAAAALAEAGVAREVPAPDAFWCDDITGGAGTTELAAATAALFADGAPLATVGLFGGVAFKYTSRYTDDPATAADEARLWAGYVDVVTTSGPGTNASADPAKVAAIAAAVPDGKRVALASGVSPENLATYAPHCTDVLVASSLETEPYSGVLIPSRLAAMAAALEDLTVDS